jgi:cell division protease FtsH
VNSTVKTIIFWVVILFAAVALWQVVKNANSGQKVQEINITQFMAEVDHGTIKEINVTGMEVKGKKTDGSLFHTTASSTRNDQGAGR